MRKFAAVLPVLALATSSQAHDADHKMKAQLGSSVAFDRHGGLWLVGRDDDGHLTLRKSTDDGKRWSSPAVIGTESAVASGDERPRIAFGPHDEIYITYSRPLEKPYTSEVRFIHSDDGGLHFSAPYTVHKDRKIVTHGFASLAVDAAGLVYVTWIDKRDPRSVAQYYAVSADAGRSFGADHKIADPSCECCRSALALSPHGQPVLMWRHVFAPNIRDHAVTELTPDGMPGRIERASFDNWAIDACPHQGPSMAFGDDGRRHQTWFTGDGLFYASQGHAPMRLGGDQAGYADVAVSGRRIEVVWKEFDGQATYIKGIGSQDGGASWQAHTLATTGGASDQPRLAKNGKRIFLVWRTELSDVTTVEL